jgi:hypothetical protein
MGDLGVSVGLLVVGVIALCIILNFFFTPYWDFFTLGKLKPTSDEEKDAVSSLYTRTYCRIGLQLGLIVVGILVLYSDELGPEIASIVNGNPAPVKVPEEPLADWMTVQY